MILLGYHRGEIRWPREKNSIMQIGRLLFKIAAVQLLCSKFNFSPNFQVSFFSKGRCREINKNTLEKSCFQDVRLNFKKSTFSFNACMWIHYKFSYIGYAILKAILLKNDDPSTVGRRLGWKIYYRVAKMVAHLSISCWV